MTSDSQKRRKIRGTSMKKFDFSTSFLVAPHVMLYEMRCAMRAWDRWIDRPPKKKKLCARLRKKPYDRRYCGINAYKNGIQVTFSTRESIMLR
jgi:hypothetical protein